MSFEQSLSDKRCMLIPGNPQISKATFLHPPSMSTGKKHASDLNESTTMQLLRPVRGAFVDAPE